MDLQDISSALPPPRPSFLGLPLELRNEIYRNLLSTRRTRIDLGLGRARYSLQTAILATNRQIHDEGTKVWRENRFINITTPWTSFKQDVLVQGKFPIIAESEGASSSSSSLTSFMGFHMLVVLYFMADANTTVFYNYLTCLEDLPLLCQLLFYTSCQTPNFSSLLHITLAIRDPHTRPKTALVPKALQESLMMPFAILKGLDGLTIRGARNKAVEKELRKAMSMPNPTAAEDLESAAQLKDAGNAAFKAGDYALSIRTYIRAYEAMHFIVQGKRFAIMLDGYFASSNPLIGGRFDGRRGDLVRHHLGSQLSWNILQAYLKMRDWEHAYFWGERAISDLEYADVQQSILDGTPNLVTGAEKAKVYWRMAVACKALDRKQVWTRSLMKASMFAPQDKAIMRELVALEKRLEKGELKTEDLVV